MNTVLSILLSVVISATMDSTYIPIGDQTDIHLSATLDRDARVQLPVYGENIIPGIEIVDRTPIDTTRTDDGRMQIHQQLTITSFKDSLFLIPEMPFLVDGDTLYSAPLTLNVIQPFEVDSTNAITDIKPVAKAPIWWWGIIRWILLILGLIGLGIGIFFLVRYLRRKAGNVPEVIEPEVLRPAEEIALEKLAVIREEKVWQQGQTKEYHTQLTDVIREYIGRRYDIHSTEKTSDETLREMKPVLSEQRELYSRLEKMLRLADLVKFAKWTATPDENESALKTAYDFVDATTPKPETSNA